MSTSRGQTIVRQYILAMSDSPFKENYRPEWMEGLELDFYFPEHKIGIEFNGDQHLYFNGLSGNPYPQMLRDSRKRKICRSYGVTLISLDASDLHYGVIRRKLKKFLPLARGLESLADLDHESAKYRFFLKTEYNSPTAFKKGNRGIAIADANRKWKPDCSENIAKPQKPVPPRQKPKRKKRNNKKETIPFPTNIQNQPAFRWEDRKG